MFHMSLSGHRDTALEGIGGASGRIGRYWGVLRALGQHKRAGGALCCGQSRLKLLHEDIGAARRCLGR